MKLVVWMGATRSLLPCLNTVQSNTPIDDSVANATEFATLRICPEHFLFLAWLPVYGHLLGTIENRIDIRVSEIIPCPLNEGFNLRASWNQQKGVNGKPCNESNRTCYYVTLLANLRYRRVAPNHCHDPFVEVMKRLYRLPCNRGRDLVSTIVPCLLRDRCKLRQRFTVRACDVRKVS